MNSPDTELFHKGNVLYNFVRARKAQQKDGTVIAVEGYMDVIALAQAGFENAVAPLGTALTEIQLELLWRMTGEPCSASMATRPAEGAWRAADMALPLIQAGRTVRFALLPEGKDPDDLVPADGPDAFRQCWPRHGRLPTCCGCAKPPEASSIRRKNGAELEKTLRELVSRIRDESVRYHYQQEMRERVLAFFGTTRSRPQRQGDRDQRQGTAARQPGVAAGACGVRQPGAFGAGQARRRHHAVARNRDYGGAGQPPGS